MIAFLLIGLLALSSCKVIFLKEPDPVVTTTPFGKRPQVTTIERHVSWKIVED